MGFPHTSRSRCRLRWVCDSRDTRPNVFFLALMAVCFAGCHTFFVLRYFRDVELLLFFLQYISIILTAERREGTGRARIMSIYEHLFDSYLTFV